jgi:hypothetical protein
VKRVLVSAFSPMLHSIIVETLSTRSDVSLVLDGPGVDPSRCDVDVVLTTAADPDPGAAAIDLLWRWPKGRVVVVAPSGRDAVLYELVPRKHLLGDLCPAALVEAVCGERRES